MSTPLYFITGFFGSGKTTLLNNILEQASAQNKKLGVIINEWGEVSVDSMLVSQQQSEIAELNNGQVFCSCLSNNFIDILVNYAMRPLDAVVVETSGMANPLPLQKILLDLKQIVKDHYSYKGMTALVDPESFLDLHGAVNAVDEQIMASNRIIINKIDITPQESLQETRRIIEDLNPEAEIIETSYAKIDNFFTDEEITAKSGGVPGQDAYSANLGKHLITTSDKLEPEQVSAFFRVFLPKSLRIKGVFQTKDGSWLYADAVNEQISVRPLGYEGKETLFVAIPRAGEDLYDDIRKAWKQFCPGRCKVRS